jgi:hypothetical protein
MRKGPAATVWVAAGPFAVIGWSALRARLETFGNQPKYQPGGAQDVGTLWAEKSSQRVQV